MKERISYIITCVVDHVLARFFIVVSKILNLTHNYIPNDLKIFRFS